MTCYMQCMFGSVSATCLTISTSLFGLMVVLLAVVFALADCNDTWGVLWRMYADFVGNYIQLSSKELVALAIAMLLIIRDLVKPLLMWAEFCHKTSVKSPGAAAKYAAEADKISKIRLESINFMLKVAVASAIFWFFSK